MDEFVSRKWRARIKKRRGKAFHPGTIRELNLVAMMDMLTVIVVFLLKSYSVSAMSIPVGEQISFPKSSSEAVPQEAIKLTVTKIGLDSAGVIAVDEANIVELTKEKVSSLEKMAKARQFLIPELREALLQKAAGIKEIAKLNESQKFEGKILVLADKETPYWLVTQVLFTAASAEFDQYSLVALREDQ